MSNKKRILLVEDDVNLGFMLLEYLEENGFNVKLYRDGESGYNAYTNGYYDFCILDLMLPKMDGFTLAKKIRKHKIKTPILMLTSRSMNEDKLKGFKIGIDDYVTKPFNEEELVCRINAILSRYEVNKSQFVKEYTIGQFVFNRANLSLNGFNDSKRLTKKEGQILALLSNSKNEIVERSEILNNVWGEDDYFTGRSLDVFISKLRKYFKEDPSISIESIPNVGLILKVE
ncbi:response regulator transcription factor [Tenacibaculum aiptasiae]|uniref:response regulator transcription factor n=1 Tax=Tenacibaculum aiptasiae TaxID=426481 RepID=UPI00232FE349|nr:response regulator transcription factor [Tenacibaculum aiptasiae]